MKELPSDRRPAAAVSKCVKLTSWELLTFIVGVSLEDPHYFTFSAICLSHTSTLSIRRLRRTRKNKKCHSYHTLSLSLQMQSFSFMWNIINASLWLHHASSLCKPRSPVLLQLLPASSLVNQLFLVDVKKCHYHCARIEILLQNFDILQRHLWSSDKLWIRIRKGTEWNRFWYMLYYAN